MADPFYSLKAEVEAALTEIGNSHNWSSRQVEDALQRIQWDVEMLEESIERVTANSDKFQISASEIDRRRDFVRGVKKQVDRIRVDLSGGYSGVGQGSGKASDKESLLGTRKEQEERARAKKQLNQDNQAFIDDEGQRQQLISRQLDDHLDVLHLSVTRIGEMGLTISHELKEQDAIIDDLQETTDRSVHNMAEVNKLISDMLKSKEGRKQICLIITLVAALMFVTALIFFLP